MPSKMRPLDYLAVLQFQGEDTREFLQGQLAADMGALGAKKPVFACVCNVKGRVLGLLLLTVMDEETILAVCSAELASAIEMHLSRYVLRARVKISRRDDLVVCAVPEGAHIDEAIHLIEHFAGRYALKPGMGNGRSERTDSSFDSWQAGEMTRGIQWLGEATSGVFLPQMLGLQNIGALSFTKGCYPGQEVIARTRHLGRLKRHPLLCLVQGDAQAAPMDEVVLWSGSEEASAVVVKAVRKGPDHTLVMLVARTPEEFTPERMEWAESSFPVISIEVPGAETSLQSGPAET